MYEKQFGYFLVCLVLGLLFGIVYVPFYKLKKLIPNKYVAIFADVIYFILLSLSYLFASYLFRFPALRAYMPLGVFLGQIIFMLLFRFFVAKIQKKMYNSCADKRRIAYDKRKTKENG